MKHSDQGSAPAEPEEMVIVDTFTRLIFGDGGDFSRGELRVIEALRCVEPDVAADDLAAMGDYLRALGVTEMVELVARVRHYSAGGPPLSADSGNCAASPSRAH